MQDCPGDVDDVTILRNLRAGEVCRKLLRNGVLDSSIFAPTGSSYRDIGEWHTSIRLEDVAGMLSSALAFLAYLTPFLGRKQVIKLVAFVKMDAFQFKEGW